MVCGGVWRVVVGGVVCYDAQCRGALPCCVVVCRVVLSRAVVRAVLVACSLVRGVCMSARFRWSQLGPKWPGQHHLV